MTNLIPTAKGLAIASSFFAAGGFGVTSFMTAMSYIAAIPTDHILVAKQFAAVYGIGYITQPPSTLLSACCHGFVAYHLYHRPGLNGSWRAWAISSALTAAILPWTFILMEPQSHSLLQIAGMMDKTPSLTERVLDDDELNRARLFAKEERLTTPATAAHVASEEYDRERLLAFDIMVRWSDLNTTRAILALVSGSLSLWATLR